MARVPWVFDGYEWPINPEKDGGWSSKEDVLGEKHPLGSKVSTFHFVAHKSARRQSSGWLWGAKSLEQKLRLERWRFNRTVSLLVDHVGETKRCFISSLKLEAIQDMTSWREGRQTWKYDLEFVEV